MKYRWKLAPVDALLADRLAGGLRISRMLAQCLINRELDDPARAASFLSPRLKGLADPSLIPGMNAAVDRLWLARTRGEAVVIFGDYDADGVTATTLLIEVLIPLGWKVNHYLPHRLDEGYGLTLDGVENCRQRFPVDLLLAVDCGSTAVESIARLKDEGVEVIVLDHHQVSNPAPPAVALVNPQLGPSGATGFRELSSVGIAFKLAHALVKRGREMQVADALKFDLRPLLDLVALGTIADLVPVMGENRILVTAGLERLNALERPGLRALKEVAQIPGPIGPFEVGFQLGPRLNAAGRLENATAALELLRATSADAAGPLALALDATNRERQNIERGIATEVIGAVRARFKPDTDFVIVEGQLLWHVGVVGIVASRVLQEFYRPTLILGGDGHEWRGSGRSIEGFDLASALRECSDLLVRHGGHAMAAGITIDPEKVPQFRTRLNELARRALRPDQLQPPLRIDAESTVGELSLERLRELALLQPCGQGNPPVQLLLRGLTHRRAPVRVGREQQHVKFWVGDQTAAAEAVWWNPGERTWPEGLFDLVAAPQINQFGGRTSVQLRVIDWRPGR